MSDYFGALLRSAGAVPADVHARTPPGGGGDPVEQDVEVEAGVAPPTIAAAWSPEAPVKIGPAPLSHGESTVPSNPEPRDVERSEPASSRVPRPAPVDEVHPVVRAALQWVAADPVPAARVVPASASPQAPSEPPPQEPLPSVASPSARTVRLQPFQPATRIENDDARPLQMPTAEARRPSLPRETNPAQPQANRACPEVVAITEPRVFSPNDRVEISIGTIHVAVDAPPAPRVTAQPVPPTRRPQPASPTPRSGFSRARLPRS